MSNPNDYPCVHRGKRVRNVTCDMCDRMKGQSFVVFSCVLHGECTPHKVAREVRGCVACEDWKPPEAVR